MIICITAKGPSLDSLFEPHFARAPYFIFFDTRTRKSEAIRNGFIVHDTKIGQNAVRLLITRETKTLVTGSVGDNAERLLRGAKIDLCHYETSGTVSEALSTLVPGSPGKSRVSRVRKETQQR
jgi:predicted Fe-Mo cluster-binding NifX family protein